ncbi:Radical SAM/Cys-rich domain protein [Balamuthia mandrillaris]
MKRASGGSGLGIGRCFLWQRPPRHAANAFLGGDVLPFSSVVRAFASEAFSSASAPLRPLQFDDLSDEDKELHLSYLKRLEQRESRVQAKRKAKLDQMSSSLPSFLQKIEQSTGKRTFCRTATEIMQINIGLLCNQTCQHCHVESSPSRVAENMQARTIDRLLDLVEATPTLTTVDITGGAPELNPHFRRLILGARSRGITHIIDRCNLTVLLEAGQEDTAEFLAEQKVQVVASLPCYTFANVDMQRGSGVFQKSIQALKRLNELGYGKEGTGLLLHLVYNPLGPSLPAPQKALEEDYRRELRRHFSIEFNQLFTITNMPIRRFADFLMDTGRYEEYMRLLVDNFNPATVDALMCKNTVSISWDGRLFDCDFNQMMSTPLGAGRSKGSSIWEVDSLDFRGTPIATDKHCYGCTAGAGSSCGGALHQ